jgi:hypothetical protein
MSIIGRYAKDDQTRMAELLAHLVTTLEEAPRDVLGPLYMELEIASKDRGQFFTPPELSEMMAQMTFGAELGQLDAQPFITVHEPACGAGGMVLALVKVMIANEHNPADKLWVQCTDIDRLAALMCFVQLSLWNVPAEIVVGNTLTLETREVWHTPAHHLGFWANKLKRRAETKAEADSPPPEPVADIVAEAAVSNEATAADPDDLLPTEPRADPVYDDYRIDWHGQAILIRHCAAWLGQETAHIEIHTEDRSPHPISETGYRSHFVHQQHIEAEGGSVAYVETWLRSLDDGKPKQLSLF